MGADQQFCLRWNNFHTNITSAFESLRDDEDFVDITLACEGRQIKAHKMVLSACSPYFRSLLRGNPCQHPIVFLKDVSFANLTSILDFMYHGEVNVSHNELATFLKTAEALRVRGLAEDEKKRDGDTCTESSSPPPPRDPPEPCSPGRPDDPPGEGGGGVRISNAGDGGGAEASSTPSNMSEGPPTKRQRRRSGPNIPTSITPSSEHDLTNTDVDHLQQQSETVGRESVKNEPEDYVNEDDDMLGQQQQQHQQIANEDIKLDGFAGSNAADDHSEYLSGESSMSSRSQAAMQQLQDTFNTFIPGMAGQSPGPGFLQPPVSADHGRPHPPFSLEGVQGLPPGLSALPGPSMSQAGGASQDASGQGGSVGGGGLLFGNNLPPRRGHPSTFKRGVNKSVLYRRTNCPLCARSFFNKYSLKRHMIQSHHENHVHTRPYSSFARSQSQFVKRILTEQWARREGAASVSPGLGVGGVPPPPPLTPSSSVYGIDDDHPPHSGRNTGSLLDDGGGFMDRFNNFGGGSLGRGWNDVESGEDTTLGESMDREGESSGLGSESATQIVSDVGALCQSELFLRREDRGSSADRNSVNAAAFTQNFDFQDLN